ncbi:MAG: hypothetical protein OEV28_03160 [Nitrospirota bacterium]|nr:hypothetical protein [Nitrospirota bacterium]
MKRTALFGAAVAIILAGGTAFAASDFIAEAKSHCGDMVVTGKEVINHGQMNHTAETLKYLYEMKNHAEQCYVRIEKGMFHSQSEEIRKHGKDGISHLSPALGAMNEAVKHGEAGNHEELVKNAKEAMKHAVEANTHVKAMK